MTTPQHCPGFEKFRKLTSFYCRCGKCGAESEIFSDEFDRPHTCHQCREPIFQQCAWHAGSSDVTIGGDHG